MKCIKLQQQLAANETIKPNKHQRVLETIVKNATQMWCSNPIHLRNPLQFLQLTSHCINDTFMEASQIQISAMESSDTHSGAAAAAAAGNNDNDDDADDDEHSFNLLKSNAINRKIRLIKKNGIVDSESLSGSTVDCINVRQINSNNDCNNSVVHIESSAKKIESNSSINEINFNKSEPPPLAFFRGNLQTPIIFSATEPPPLVPIARINFA